MLEAYEAPGLHIDEVPADHVKLLLHQIQTHEEARRILSEAEQQRPDVKWYIVGTGPWGVRGEPVEEEKQI